MKPKSKNNIIEWSKMSISDRIKHLERKRDNFQNETGNYQKYNNAIKALKKMQSNHLVELYSYFK